MSFGSPHPAWPLATPPKPVTGGGSFGSHREDTPDRDHQGADLGAPEGTPVIAVDDGVIATSQGWRGDGTAGLWVDHDGDGYANTVPYTALYGGVKPGSWPPVGTKVRKGDQIAVVGRYPGGSTMLHWEAWIFGQRAPRPVWLDGAAKPSALYDPTEYLERAAKNPNPEIVPMDDSSGVVVLVAVLGVATVAAALILPRIGRRRR